jgi:hypothetical protein
VFSLFYGDYFTCTFLVLGCPRPLGDEITCHFLSGCCTFKFSAPPETRERGGREEGGGRREEGGGRREEGGGMSGLWDPLIIQRECMRGFTCFIWASECPIFQICAADSKCPCKSLFQAKSGSLKSAPRALVNCVQALKFLYFQLCPHNAKLWDNFTMSNLFKPMR